MVARDKIELEILACKVRQLVIEGVYNAKCGHPGGSLSCADAITYLYFKELNIDPKNPEMPERDRFVLSKGHCVPALYAALALRGFFPVEEMKNLRKVGSMLQGHPCYGYTPGIDASTGSLGQGISIAAGLALATKKTGSKSRTFALLGDGELEEGQVWEALMFAAHKQLADLTAIVDNNNLQIDGEISKVNSPYPIAEKFEAFGWHAIETDGHDFEKMDAAFHSARAYSAKPTAIILKTVKGKGVSYMENNAGWHGKAPKTEEYEIAMKELKTQLAHIERKKNVIS